VVPRHSQIFGPTIATRTVTLVRRAPQTSNRSRANPVTWHNTATRGVQSDERAGPVPYPDTVPHSDSMTGRVIWIGELPAGWKVLEGP